MNFFLKYHCLEKISQAIDRQEVWLLKFEDETIVATGSCEGHILTRVFVTPSYQNQGLGALMISKLESEIQKTSSHELRLDASLPAVGLYEKLGYQTLYHQQEVFEDGSVLVWPVMKKG